MSEFEFPDAESVLMELLDPFGFVCNALPEGKRWAELFPLVWVMRIGGGEDSAGVSDRPLMQVVVLHRSRPEAFAVSQLVRRAVLGSGRTSVGGVLIDSARENFGFQRISDLNPEVAAVESSFWLSFRRHSVA